MGKFDMSKWAPTIFSLVTLTILGAQGLFGAGGWMSGQAKDVVAIQGEYTSLQRQQDNTSLEVSALKAQMAALSQLPGLIGKLNDRLDAAPRADLLDSRLLEIQRHLSALDGRGDATETRLRADEDRVIRDDARLDAIENASKVKLR